MKIGRQEQAVLVRQYKTGYRKKPEDKHEVEVAEAMAVCLLAGHCPFYGLGKRRLKP